jgi:hypothetical protein
MSLLVSNPQRQHAAAAAGVRHNAEHNRRMLVDGFQVTWDIQCKLIN